MFCKLASLYTRVLVFQSINVKNYVRQADRDESRESSEAQATPVVEVDSDEIPF